MRVGNDQRIMLVFLKLLIVMLGQFFKKPGLSHQPLGVAITFFLTSKNSKIKPETVKHPSQSFGRILSPLMIGKIITDIPQDLNRVRPVFLGKVPGRIFQSLRPTRALPRRLPHGIAVFRNILQHLLNFSRKTPVQYDLFPDRRHDFHHVDFLRTDPETVHAGCAKPEIFVLKKIHPSLKFSEEFPRSVTPNMIHRTHPDTLCTLITPSHRFSTRGLRHFVHKSEIISGQFPGFVHSVPNPGNIDPFDNGFFFFRIFLVFVFRH